MASSLSDLAKDSMHERGYGAGGEDDTADYDASGEAAMGDFIKAVHARDPKGAWTALKTAYDLCDKAGGMGDEPDGDEGKGKTHALALLLPHPG